MVSFPDHLSLLTAWLDHRARIADDIDRHLLNVQGKAAGRNRDEAALARLLDSCFFDRAGVPRSVSQLKGQLAAAHVADGFEPVLLERQRHQFDPIELVFRAYAHWHHHRWPGRNGRLAFAETVYAVFVLRQLELLSLRIWDEGDADAGERLREIQSVLDRLNGVSAAYVFVRDARWLLQTAQGALTRHLSPYFMIASRISSSLTDGERLEAHKAGVTLAGGHLRSQLRYRAAETGRAPDDPELLAITRNSNSMDAALLVWDLVPVLVAYKESCAAPDRDRRVALADVVLQGASADPELFLTRLDVLGPCTVIEDVFVERSSDGRPRHTPFGAAHLQHVARYRALIAELAGPLGEDALTLSTERRSYSPLGISYGFCADILSHMAIDALHSQSSFGLSLEDMFTAGSDNDASRATRARNWETRPTGDGRREHFEHSLTWAAEVIERTRTAVTHGVTHATQTASRQSTGRLFVVPEARARSSPPSGAVPDGVVAAQEHCVTSDLQRALATGATAFPKSQILLDRKEGRFLASAEIDGKWFGVSKVLLTACICRRKAALITDVPQPVVDILRMTCPELLVISD